MGKKIIGIAVLGLILSACNTGSTKVSTSYYKIKAQNAKQLNRQIKLKGPKVARRHALAVTQLSFQPKITFEKTFNSCQINQARLNIDAQIRLPKWVDKYKAPKDLRKSWKSYASYAKVHEGVHVKIAKAFAKNTVEAIRALPVHKNCKSLTKSVKRVLSKMSRAHNKAQLQFDKDEQKRIKKLIAKAKREAKANKT